MFERGLSYLEKARVARGKSSVLVGFLRGPFAANLQRYAPSKLAKRLLLLLLLLLLLRDSSRVYEAGKRTSFGQGGGERNLITRYPGSERRFEFLRFYGMQIC